jgi:CO/xanthine dehydrogenase Mo-binding subunit
MEGKSVSRRQFVKDAGALIVSFHIWGTGSSVLAQSKALADAEPDVTSLDSWLAIAQDETITVFTSKVDLGTGVLTALSQIVADELDVPFGQITMETGDTAKTVDQGTTAASRTLQRAGPQLRQASAAARHELLKLASARLGVPEANLNVNAGVVTVVDDPSRKISYGELIGGQRFNVKVTATGRGWDLKVAPEVRPKDPRDYKIVGTSVPRVDLPAKFTGQYTYSQDVAIPGMLHGRVVRPPVVNSKPVSVDESSISKIPGIVKIVQEGSFLGVVATTEWSAIRAANELRVTWSTPATKLPANPDELYAYLRDTKSFSEQSSADKGNPELAFTRASKTFESTYRWPFQLHGMIGPSCAVADVQGDKATIWTGSQGTFVTRKSVAALLAVPEKNVRVVYREGAGCFGRLEKDDVPQDAALMSRAVGKPVRVQWMRHDEHGWEPKGPAQLITVRAGVDAQGTISSWDFVDRSFPWTEDGNPLLASRQVGLKPAWEGKSNGFQNGGEIYQIENQKVRAQSIPWLQQDPTPLRTCNLRAPGSPGRCFASETCMDEIASYLKVDPVELRLRYLGRRKRETEGLLAATKKAQWDTRPSPSPASLGTKAVGRGVALNNSSNTVVAAVAEVEVNRLTGQIAVKRLTLAHDCGLIVNPNGLQNQIEGNAIQATSRALFEEVQFDAAGVKSLDWASYPIITYEDVPDVEIVLINHPEMEAGGAGEASSVPVPAAIANAVFDAVGVRLREAPFTPERVLAALRASGASPA